MLKRAALAIALVAAAALIPPACTDPCKDAADKVAACHKAFCDARGAESDRARMDCLNWSVSCPDGAGAACFDTDKCASDGTEANRILNGECDEATGDITTAAAA